MPMLVMEFIRQRRTQLMWTNNFLKMGWTYNEMTKKAQNEWNHIIAQRNAGFNSVSPESFIRSHSK